MNFKTFKLLGLALSLASGALAEKSGYAPVNGLKLYYEIRGLGRGGGVPLVLLHGGGSTIDTTFGQAMKAFAKERKVIAIEEQGHGHTGDIDRPLSFEASADDVAGLLGFLKIEKADILGFSNGGNTAMQVAIRYPQLVRKLVVASAFYKREGLYPAVWDSFKAPGALDPKNMPAVLREAYLKSAPDPSHLEALVGKLMRRLNGFKDWPDSALKGIQSPTLVMIGDADIVKPEHAVAMARLLPRAKLAILPGGHGEYLGEAVAVKKGSRVPALAAVLILDFLEDPVP